MLVKGIFCHETSCKWMDLKTFFKTLNASFFFSKFCSHFSVEKLFEFNALVTLIS